MAVTGVPSPQPEGTLPPARVFISYAHEDAAHQEAVQSLWLFLRRNGVDARIDLTAAEEPQDWPAWMAEQLRRSDFVLVVGSPEYRKRAEGAERPDVGRGVQWEARQIRDLLYGDHEAGRLRVLPVLLPGRTVDDLPDWLTPNSSTTYAVSEFSISGAEPLYRVLTRQRRIVEPPLGAVVRLGREDVSLPDADGDVVAVAGPLRTEVLVRVSVADGELASELVVAGTSLGRRSVPAPVEAWQAWGGLRIGAAAAVERMTSAGVALGRAVFDESSAVVVSDLVNGLRPGDGVDVVLVADDAASSLPIELLRLPDPRSAEVQPPLALRVGVTVRRQLSERSEYARPTPGPLKVLAAVAAPEESRTPNPPLDVEAEMQAVLGAVQALAGHEDAQAQILEVASLEQIAAALEADAYHVLHLSAHGSPTEVELEDEDGDPHLVTAQKVMDALKRAGKPVPLIVLSACSGAATASEAIATELIRRGADRVIAMQAPVTDRYATRLAAALYRRLAGTPELPVGQALARARWDVEAEHGDEDGDRLPEYAVATLLSAGGDGPLVDVAAAPAPLARVTLAPSGKSVRELSMGQLIGRRRELRQAAAVLRRTPEAVERFGVLAGVQLTGIGGIGKTALAGRLMGRLRESGWLVAVHQGKWTPDALFAALATELSGVSELRELAEALVAAGEDYPKLDLVRQVVERLPVVLLFDDFEQNLTSPGGEEFADPGFEGLFRELCESTEVGAVLVTCRYPVPGLELDLLDLPVGSLSPAELGRLFLRLPAIRDLEDVEDRRLIARAIGGHPRLIEFVDALIRGRGAAGLREVQDKLRNLARKTGVDLRRPQAPGGAVNTAMLLGSADILLDRLLALLTDTEREALAQVAVSRAPMSVDDLAFALERDDAASVRADVERLAALTLVALREDQVDMHPWTGELITRNTPEEEQLTRHERALAMRLRRFEERTAGYPDLLEVPRHLARLGRYNDLASVAEQATGLLNGTLARTAYLAELRPLVPSTERAWSFLCDLELDALIAVGDLVRARHLAHRIHAEDQARVAADPTNTGWQRDLSVSQGKLGDLAVAAGDLTGARIAYQACLDIRQRLTAVDPTNTGWQRDLSISHNKLGDLAVAAGDLTGARTAYQAGRDIRQRLTAADPTNTNLQRDLAISHERLGDLAVAAGDLAGARTAYLACRDITQRLALADPTNAGWQRDLSVSHNKVGDLEVAAGDLTGARTAYQAGLDIRQRLTAADPTNAGWQRDLAVSHNKLGDLAVAAGDLTRARTAYQASLVITQRLSVTDPTNTEWQRDLSISHNKVGDLAVAAGDLTGARTAYEASLVIRQRLTAADPTNAAWQRDLAVSHNKLADLAVAAGDLTRARAAYQACLDIRQRLTAADPTNTEWQRDLAISHNKLGDLAMAAGDLTNARTAYQAGLDITQRLTAADPTNTSWQRDLAVSHNKVGDLAVAAGDLAGARTAYQACLDITHRLSAADPTNAGWQRDLAVSHNKVGDLAVAAGDLTRARIAYQAGLGITQRLTAADPTNTGWQRDLSISHNKLGDLAMAAGDLTHARTAYQASLDIRQRLATTDPTNTAWQRDLAISHERLGDLAMAAGDLTGARIAYQTGRDIRRRLTAADPTNTGWQRDLSISHNKVGDLEVATGDLTRAGTAYQAGLDITQRLTATDPTNAGWQRDLAVSHNKVGDLAVAAGDLTRARTAYQACLDITQRLTAADPTNTEWQRDLAISHNKLADLAMAAGDLTRARTAYQASLDITQRLTVTDPTNTEWQRDLAISHNKLGDVAMVEGDLAGAGPAYRAGLDITQRLTAADPTNTEWQRDLSISHERLGDLAVAAGDLTGALAAYEASLDIRQRLTATDPTNTEWQRDLSITHERLGDLAVAAGDLTGALAAYEASLDIRQRLTATDPTNTGWQRDLAISHNKLGELAVAADDLTGARTAYEAGHDIRQRLTATDPTNTGWQRDLAISHERLGDLAVAAGDLTGARTAYQTGLDITQGLTAADPTNAGWQRDLAISHVKLGDLAVAAGDLASARTAYQTGLDITRGLSAADPSDTELAALLTEVETRLRDLDADEEPAPDDAPASE